MFARLDVTAARSRLRRNERRNEALTEAEAGVKINAILN